MHDEQQRPDLPTVLPQPKTTVLTGASRGIGHSAVKLFSQVSWRIITFSRHPFNRERCPWDHGAEDHVQVDLANYRSVSSVIGEIQSRLRGGPLHALVNNAGSPPNGANNMRMTSLTTSPEMWMSVFHVNSLAPVLLARGLFRQLRMAGGTVVNVTSIVETRVHPFAGTAYATSKAGLACLTHEMADDFASHEFRVNAIAPGETKTDILSPDSEG